MNQSEVAVSPDRVLVEVNTGMNRCGVEPGQGAVDLAKVIADLPGLRFRPSNRTGFR